MVNKIFDTLKDFSIRIGSYIAIFFILLFALLLLIIYGKRRAKDFLARTLGDEDEEDVSFM